MKNAIKLILFLICTSGVFFVDNHIVISLIIVFNFILVCLLRISLKEVINWLSKLIFFIFLTVAFNLVFDNLEHAILLGIKLIIVCNITFTYSKNTTSFELANAIETLIFPLKILKINTKDISIIICIAINFIPILNKEIINFNATLKVKSCKFKINNLNLILNPFFASILKRIDMIDKTLKSKAYI